MPPRVAWTCNILTTCYADVSLTRCFHHVRSMYSERLNFSRKLFPRKFCAWQHMAVDRSTFLMMLSLLCWATYVTDLAVWKIWTLNIYTVFFFVQNRGMLPISHHFFVNTKYFTTKLLNLNCYWIFRHNLHWIENLNILSKRLEDLSLKVRDDFVQSSKWS